MKKNLNAILIVVGLFVVIIALNFLFIAGNNDQENEENGNRSSYRATPFGTLAFYTLLEEKGYPVTRLESRWTELNERKDISTLVVISPLPSNNPTPEEFGTLNAWLEKGGLLIVIDREIEASFGDATADGVFSFSQDRVRVLQPTIYTRGVNSIKLSNFARRVKLESRSAVYHIGDEQGAVLADAEVNKGRVILLTDPFVVANNGIAQNDNVQLALNLFSGRPDGKIAFDEFHHGFSEVQSGGVMAYFRGTPIPWMLAQIALIAAFVVYSYGRRFARPVPLRRERRTTNLEFVSSMANITRLARATDIAMQNVYSEFQKRLCRYCGLPPNTEIPKLAAATARRANLSEDELKTLLLRCSGISLGAKVSDPELLALVTRIRDIESQLKL